MKARWEISRCSWMTPISRVPLETMISPSFKWSYIYHFHSVFFNPFLVTILRVVMCIMIKLPEPPITDQLPHGPWSSSCYFTKKYFTKLQPVPIARAAGGQFNDMYRLMFLLDSTQYRSSAQCLLFYCNFQTYFS